MTTTDVMQQSASPKLNHAAEDGACQVCGKETLAGEDHPSIEPGEILGEQVRLVREPEGGFFSCEFLGVWCSVSCFEKEHRTDKDREFTLRCNKCGAPALIDTGRESVFCSECKNSANIFYRKDDEVNQE